jgi:hypothetical protein
VVLVRNKKLRIVLLVIIGILILSSIISIVVGIYLDKLSKPQYIFGKVIDKTSTKINDYLNQLDEIDVGDNFTITTNINFNINSEYYKKTDLTADELKEKARLNNLNNLNTNIVLKQDKKNKQAYFSIEEKIKEEDLVTYKYLVDNSTEYFYLNGLLSNYINDGNCNYFETLDNENTTKSNLTYLYNFTKTSLKNNLKEEYFKSYQKESYISGENQSVNQISLTLTDTTIKKILKGILKDLKNDEKANKILTGINEDFKNTKVDYKKKYLETNETITINIYTTKVLSTPLKYEVIDTKDNSKKTYYYEGNDSNGTIYIIDNDEVKYQIDTTIKSNSLVLNINDSKNNNVGKLKLENDNTGLSITYSYDDSIDKYEYNYKSKYTYNDKKDTYSNDIALTFKVVNNKVTKYDGEVTITTDISKSVKIDEDTSNQVLKSSLTEEQNAILTNKQTKVKERLEK